MVCFQRALSCRESRWEHARIAACLEDKVTDSAAEALLLEGSEPIRRLIELPPADMRLDERDPGFPNRTTKLAAIVVDTRQSASRRLAALGGILYQVRNNLAHGDKDPIDGRDQMLVTTSNQILKRVLDVLEQGLGG